MENTSGHGAAATIPAEVDRWSWGAFLLNWIWGIGNKTYVALLMFVPIVNMIMIFVLGAKGSSWAWRNKHWESVEQFKAVQRRWALWGVGVWAGTILLFVALFFSVAAALKSSEAYKLALAKLSADEQVTQIIGTPISAGTPSGSVEVSGPRGKASLSFDVEGPKGKGTASLEAVKDLGQWKIQHLVIQQEGTGRRIDLIQ